MSARNSRNPKPIKIRRSEMLSAIRKSGYLLEQRVFPVLERSGYYVDPNPAFKDSNTGKSREYDFRAMSAIKVFREEYEFLYTFVIGECMNNDQPVVFFETNPIVNFLFCDDLRCAGIPLYFADPEEDGDVSLQDFFRLDKFHHYCNGLYSTQYCNLKLKSKGVSEWMAWHDEEHHSIFNSLINATEFETGQWFANWVLPDEDKEEFFELKLFYPLLILRGDLFTCKQSKNRPILTKQQHVQFRREVARGNSSETYHIDVIVESYVPKYLEILDKESDALVRRLRRKKRDVRNAIERITNKARDLASKEARPDFRSVLDFSQYKEVMVKESEKT